MGTVQGQGDDDAGAVTLATGIVGLLGGATLGLLQPLFIVGIGAGIYGGPSWVGLVFLLCIPVALVLGLLVMFAGNRALTLPVLALVAGLAIGLLAGNWLATALGIGFAASSPAGWGTRGPLHAPGDSPSALPLALFRRQIAA